MSKVVQIRYAAKTGKYKLGNDWVRDPARVQVVRELREGHEKGGGGATLVVMRQTFEAPDGQRQVEPR